METELIDPVVGASTKEPQSIEFARPALYPKQEAAIFDQARYSCIEAGTKSGKTAGCIIWLAEKAVGGRPGWQYWWIAPVTSQAKIAFRRLKQSLNPECFVANETELTIKFIATQTVACFKGADKPDSLYGEDVHAAVVDEASRIKEDAWHAVRSTLTATRGPVRIIGNVKGRKNWFYKLSRKAAGGEADMAFHKITCYDAVAAGILDQSEIEDAKSKLPEQVFKQLYEAEAADDEGNPFGVEKIRACLRSVMSKEAPVCFGWDFAKSHDWTVGIGLDRFGGVCRLERFQKPWGETKSTVKSVTGNLPAMGDSTGVGDAIVEDIQRMGVNIEAYLFSSRSKQQLMEGLAADIQQSATTFPEGVLSEELESFEYAYTRNSVTYSAPEGQFDDCVCALALARLLYRKGGYGQPFCFSRAPIAGSGDEAFSPRTDIWRRNESPLLVD